jgi:CheY-like chemotaxis protein
LSGILTDKGYSVIAVANADNAIEMLETRDDVRMLITDINMPGAINGLNLAATVRDRWPLIKIISLHAHFLLAFHSRPAYKARLSKPGVFDGQEGFEACVDFGRRQNVEDARSEENKCWTHRQKLEAI